jgi:uncharacterized hydrophobic protein (TIGR00341 family)
LIELLSSHFSLDYSGAGSLTVLSAEAVLPAQEPDEPDPGQQERAARSEIREELDSSATLNRNFVFLVALAALVAALGLIMDDVAVVIGSMVIAPLIGPVVASAFGIVTADSTLTLRGIRTELTGLFIALVIATVLGAVIPGQTLNLSEQVLLRTQPNLLNLVLALAAGTAAALSVTGRASTALVGVMVSVALLPPVLVAGLAVGSWKLDLAAGAALLLTTNLAGIVLAGLVTFRMTGIKPGKWWQFARADRSVRRAVAGIAILLLLISVALVPPTLTSIHKITLETRVNEAVYNWRASSVELSRLSLEMTGNRTKVAVQLSTTEPVPAPVLEALFAKLGTIIEEGTVSISIDQVTRRTFGEE